MAHIQEQWKLPKIEARLKGSEDYEDWAREAQAHLSHFGLWKYIDPQDIASKQPDPNDVIATTEWLAKNKSLVSIIMMMIERPLQHLCIGQTIAGSAWNAIRDSLSPRGPMYQLAMLKRALSTHFTDDCDMDAVLLSQTDTFDRMFSQGPIDPDNLRMMLLINSLKGSTFLQLRDQLEGFLTSTKDGITLAGVISRLRFEAQN